MNGIINVLKPTGITSSDAVVMLRKILNIKKIGHMGTLDPLGSGVLPIGIGKSARLFDYLLLKKKIYRATFTFGIATDTLDSQGVVVERSKVIPSEKDFKNILKDFLGEIDQIPPQYSAINISGQRAYDLARAGKDFEISSRKVTIFRIEYLCKIDTNTFMVDIECSAGTYIRSLCRDIAGKLNSKAYMSSIIRLESGIFKIEDSYTFDEIRNNLPNLSNILTKPCDVLIDLPSIMIDDSDYDKLCNGVALLGFSDGLFRVYCKGEFFGIGESVFNQLKIKTNLRD